VNLTKLRRAKITCCSSYADYRPKTNTVISIDMGHTLRKEHTQEKEEKVGNPKFESV
jgi:hypothetical protein